MLFSGGSAKQVGGEKFFMRNTRGYKQLGDCFLKKVIGLLLSVSIAVATISMSEPMQVKAAVGEQGIDVSKWQGTIDWAAVAQNNISFAFVRVGNLKKGIDETFYYNMLSAQAVGIKTGVYIYSYATTVEEAALEAQFVLNAVQNLQVSFPIVWDVEDTVQSGLSKDTLSLMANTFCAIIEAEGYYPMVYANTNWYTKKLGPVFYDKWVAQWADKCDIPDASIWQYSCTGRVNGIAGNVDLDIALKDYSSSIIQTGWLPRKGFLYYYINYKMQRGWLDLGTAKYYLDPYGRMVTGWLPLEDSVYYLQPDGVMAVGFTPIGEGMYYFDADGKMLVGLQNINGLTYFFAGTGAMYVGFLDMEDGKHFFTTDGHMLTGLQIVNNKYYLFDPVTGVMKTGWQEIGDQTYLFSAEGPMVYGWFSDGVNKYYLATVDGHRVTGFQSIEGKTYFFDNNGIMAVGPQTINGLQYLFDATGAMYTGWLTDGVTTQYYEKDGHMVTGLVAIDNAIYYFDENGNMQTGVVVIDEIPHIFDIDGKLLQ